MSKLSKAQREFFLEFARNDIGNYIFPLLEAHGLKMSHEKAALLLDMVNLDEYAEKIGQEFLARTDFKTLKRVDKFMKSDEFRDVTFISQEVSDAVIEERITILSAMLPDEEEEKSE